MSLYGGMNTVQGSNSCLCDLRSDTMTAPNDAMRAAMASGVDGDDVYGEDPTVTALESRLATLLGKEAAVFMPTGTQSNLAGLMAHCGRGDEIIVGDAYHIYCDEAAGASVLGGISMNAIATQANGAVSPAEVTTAIKVNDPHYARSRLLCLENTVGGQVIPLDDMRAADIDFLTIGQYLQPTPKHHAVDRFVTPEEFKAYEKAAFGKGFLMVSATPLTRSSYHAGDDFARLKAARLAKLGA